MHCRTVAAITGWRQCWCNFHPAEKRYENHNFEHDSTRRVGRAGTGHCVCAWFTLIANQAAHAQTFQVLYNFSGGADGAYPYAGLTTDRAGNLYGTTAAGGSKNCNGGGTCGVVFRLQNRGSGWLFNPLYSFASDGDGFSPQSRVIFGPDGALYSTTATGGTGDVGTVFKLRPLPTACKTAPRPWSGKRRPTSFTGVSDGNLPLSRRRQFRHGRKSVWHDSRRWQRPRMSGGLRRRL